MTNPYSTLATHDSTRVHHRGVLRYVGIAAFLALAAFAFVVPGCSLMTQSMKIYPGTPSAGGFVVNGDPIPTSTIGTCLLGFGIACGFGSVCLAMLAHSNQSRNRESALEQHQANE